MTSPVNETQVARWLERARGTQCCDPVIDGMIGSAIEIIEGLRRPAQTTQEKFEAHDPILKMYEQHVEMHEQRVAPAQCVLEEEMYRGLQEAKALIHSDPWAAAGILNRILSAVTSTHSSPPPVEPSPQGRPSGSGLKDGSGGGEACQTCMGSGYSAHPDSGEVCHVCKGQGTP